MAKEKKVISLTLKQVIANALKYLKRGKLQICSEKLTDSCKYYSTGGYKCVIGASLTRKQGKEFDLLMDSASSQISELIHLGLVKADRPRSLLALQKFHDCLIYKSYISIKDKTTLMEKKLNSYRKILK